MIPLVLLENEFVSLKPIDAERDSTPLNQIYLDKNMHLYTGNSVPKSKEEIYSLINYYDKYKKDMLENHYVLTKEVWRSKT